MRIAKYLLIFFVVILLAIGGAGYYGMHQIANEINNNYAGKKFEVNGMHKDEYFITFDKMSPSGFPFKISMDIHGWAEESRSAKITYPESIKVGYDFTAQQLFVTYDGDIISSYKPEIRGFGAKLKIKDYSLKIDLPISAALVKMLKNMQDPVEIINYLGAINISSGKVEIFDLVDGEKFYDKEYERFKIKFTPKKEYKNLEDILDNIPQYYTLDYSVKLHPTEANIRRLPVSLFYGFSAMPPGVNISANMVVKTGGNNIKEITKNLDIQTDISCDSKFFNLSDFKVKYKTGDNVANNNHAIDSNAKIYIKPGTFDKLFDLYKNIPHNFKKSSVGKLADREIQYIIKNKANFRFGDIENTNYDLNLVANASNGKNNQKYITIDDFNISSPDSGLRVQNTVEYFPEMPPRFLSDGLIYIKNYSNIVDFTSAYIYRFGKFKTLSDEARKLYVDVNTEFLKSISDHPESNSKDISFKYKFDSNNLKQAEFGTAKIDKFAQLYTAMMYRKLFDKVGTKGDVLSKMQKIIPSINGNDPMLKKFLPQISGGKSLEKIVDKKIKKIISGKAKDLIGKLVPKGSFDGKNLFKKLIK